MPDSLVATVHDNSIVIDGLVISNWSRDVFEQMHRGGLTAANCTCSIWEGFNETMGNIARWKKDLTENADILTQVESAADIRRAKAEDCIAILLGAEGARWLEESLEPLHLFHRLGLRELQLTWAFPNPLVPDGHLSSFGKTVLATCKDLGILVDVTHIPEPAFYDVVEAAQQPLIVSHGAFGKDVDDDKLKALAASGGLLGIHFYTSYLGPTPTPADVVEQIDAVVERVGIDHVVLTKLDEAVSFGMLIEVVHRIGTRLSFLTTGQEVPDHIETARSDRLAAMVIGEGMPS
mgnify:CR=1 FL=1